jgi:hypothetical protein
MRWFRNTKQTMLKHVQRGRGSLGLSRARSVASRNLRAAGLVIMGGGP